MRNVGVLNPASENLLAACLVRLWMVTSRWFAKHGSRQLAWDELGFERRVRILRRAQKWVLANAERVISTIVAETGKPYEDAQLAELGYVVNGTSRAGGCHTSSLPRDSVDPG